MKTAPDRLISCQSQCGDEHYVADARKTAYLWHSGQASPLYAFASTGTVLRGLASEARACADHANAMTDERRKVEELTSEDLDAVNIMADICETLGAELPDEDS